MISLIICFCSANKCYTMSGEEHIQFTGARSALQQHFFPMDSQSDAFVLHDII
jgi:hypothetical protein